MKKLIKKIGTDRLVYYPTQVKELNRTFKECLENPLKKTCEEPGILIIAVPILNNEIPGYYWVVSGRTALELMILKGDSEVEVLVYQISDESQIMDLIEALKIQDKNLDSHEVSTLIIKENQSESTPNYEEYPDLSPNPMLFLFERIFEFLVKKETDFYIFTEEELENIVKGFSKSHQQILRVHLDFLATEYQVIDYRVVQDNKGSRIYPIWLIHTEFNFPLEFVGIFKSKRENARIFKLKANRIQDFMDFFRRQPRSIRNINIEYQFVDIVLEFTTNLSLEEILIILKDIEDDPLMMETVNYIEKYTGDRIFGDWHKITDDENLISILNGESHN